MIYLTYNDQPSGVYSSQVCDVCRFLNGTLQARIRLVAFISIRSFGANRKRIREEMPGAWVLPALPTAKYWRFSRFVLGVVCLISGERNVIARNPLAAKMALGLKKTGLVRKVCLDGRGAIAAEWHEYEVISYPEMKANIGSWEKDAVRDADFRLAVSQKLVDWWRTEYGYAGNDHIVVPCTLSADALTPPVPREGVLAIRKQHGFGGEDVLLVYSGSNSGWQSFTALESMFVKTLSHDARYKVIFLTKNDPSIDRLKARFPGQVSCTWLSHRQVLSYLSMCDYGILFREHSITNQVAAPTKFAEYLAAGLPVIISEGLGDYSDFVKTNHCGMVLRNENAEVPAPTPDSVRPRMVSLAREYFTKESYLNQYKLLVDRMSVRKPVQSTPSV